MQTTPDRLGLTANEAAALLGVHPNSVYSFFNKGMLPGVRLGRKVVISRAGLEALLNGGTKPGKAK